MMTPGQVLAAVLPITEGAFFVSLESSEPLSLRYRGVMQTGSVWAPGPAREVDVVLTFEELSTLPGERMELALRAWAQVLREAFKELAQRAAPSLAPRDVLDVKLLGKLLGAKKLVAEEDFLQRWRWRLAAALPLQPEVEAAERAVIAFYEDNPKIAECEASDRRAELVFVNTERREGGITLVVRLITCDRLNGELVVRDVKEQEVRFIDAGPGLAPERVTAFLTALRECLSLFMAKIEVETMMPHDLLLAPQTFKSGKTADDFRKLLHRRLRLS